jgi:hypothetical protein
MTELTYTYRCGRKLPLTRVTTHFLSRAKRGDLLAYQFKPLGSAWGDLWSVQTDGRRLDDALERAREIGPAYPAYVVADTGRKFHVTDQIFVRFRNAADAAGGGAETFAAKHNLKVLQRLSDDDYLCQIVSADDPVAVVRRLTEQEGAAVEVDHDLGVEPQESQMVLTDPLVSLQWYLLPAPSDDVWPAALINCYDAWELGGFGSKDVVIGIIDNGCDLTDPNFDQDKFAGWAVLRDSELQTEFNRERAEEMMEPSSPHGTLCATLAAASRNQTGGLGAAPDCSLVPVKCERLQSGVAFAESEFLKIVDFLRYRVDVVSCSWYLRPDDSEWSPTVVRYLAGAARNGGRTGKGMVWVWAAGNLNCPIKHESDVAVPTDVISRGRNALEVIGSMKRFENAFATIPGVLHVGAISSFGQRCHYSNYGTGLDLVAPSSNAHRYHRIEVPGRPLGAPLGSQLLHDFGGTSAAAPLVAGVAALVRSANPELTSLEVCSILKQTADRGLNMDSYPKCGRAGDRPDERWDVSPIPPFDHGTFVDGGDPDGSWSAWFGFGKVNALKAVQEAARRAKKKTAAPPPAHAGVSPLGPSPP